MRKFIDVTHEKYKEKCGDRLGRSIKGIFTDEPRRFDSIHFDFSNERERFASTAWTEELEGEFQSRYGYDFLQHIPELFYWYKGEKVAPIKLHYFNLTCDLFCENYAEQIQSWCHDNNMIFTGHGLEEESLRSQIVCMGSIMRLYEYMDWPGVDELTETERKYWVPKQLLSVVRQLDKPRMLSELYGCTGWQFNFRSHKTVGDWQALFGVNFRCQHLSWYTMEGQAKRDYPASIFHQSPWYKYYGKVEDYFNRFNVYNTEGKPACDVLVLNPIESMFCQIYIGWHDWNKQEIASPECKRIDERYRELFDLLIRNHIDFDWGEEQIMARHYWVGTDKDGKAVLRIGSMDYHVVVISEMTTIRQTTLDMLNEFTSLGGRVIIIGETPKYCDAIRFSDEFPLLSASVQIDFDESTIVSEIRRASEEFISVTDDKGNVLKDVFIQSKHDFDGGDAFVVLNTDLDCCKNNTVISVKTDKRVHVEKWNFENGERYNADSRSNYCNGYTVIKTNLLPGGTECYVFKDDADHCLIEELNYSEVSSHIMNGSFEYELDEPNVCVLDFAKWRWCDGDWNDDKQEVLKIDKDIRKELKIMQRCEAMLQPWYIKKHGLDTEFKQVELKFEFDVENVPEKDIILVGERPEYNEYYINGEKLSCPDENDFWIDICFKKMPIAKELLRIGKNEVTVRTLYKFSTHLESVYLLGDFGVIADNKGSIITDPASTTIGYGCYSEYRMPFYTGNVTYKVSADMLANIGLGDGEKAFVTAKFYGAAVRISDKELLDEIIAWEPYEADVTDAIKANKDLFVTVLGTRKNTFGPLHTVPCVVHRCGHGSFTTTENEWTDEYNLIDDGLREIKITVKKAECE